MHVTTNMRRVEFPPMERTPIDCKMQISVLLSMHWNDALGPDCWRLPKQIRFHYAAYLRSNRVRHHLRIRRAETVREIDFLSDEIRSHARSAQLLSPKLGMGVRKLQEPIRVLERG